MTLWLVITLLTLLALSFILKPLWATRSQNYPLILILILAIPVSGLVMYLYWGHSRAFTKWSMAQENATKVKAEMARLGSQQNIIALLRKKMLEVPFDKNSAKGWFILGKLYFNQNDINEALQCFNKAAQLKPTNSEYLLQVVSTRFYVHHQLSLEDKQLITKLLALSPNNINGVNLLALDAYQQKNYVLAIRYWESLLANFAAQSEDAKNLLAMIKQARGRLKTVRDGGE